MPVSTMPVSTMHHSTNERFAALVRSMGGVHVPAAGPWDIGRGQRFGLVPRGLRARALPAQVQCGILIVSDDLLGSSLDFTVLVPDTRCCIGFTANVTRLLSVDSWQADGTTTTASGSRPVSLRLRNNGVFHQRGRQACLWLTVQATVDVPELRAAVGRWHASGLKIEAELNVHPR